MKVNKYMQKKSKSQMWGEVLVDLGKLTFGGVVLGAILRTDAGDVNLIVGGIVFCFILVEWGVSKIHKNQ
ncbi:hypothetical protein AGMMS49982_02380 [Bacteroidia bacterium]|nr:hypothetical protein AGMMS49982_02380 [Bacteroidia bacterium]